MPVKIAFRICNNYKTKQKPLDKASSIKLKLADETALASPSLRYIQILSFAVIWNWKILILINQHPGNLVKSSHYWEKQLKQTS